MSECWHCKNPGWEHCLCMVCYDDLCDDAVKRDGQITELESQLAKQKESTKAQAMLNLAHMGKYDEHLLRISRLEYTVSINAQHQIDMFKAGMTHGHDLTVDGNFPTDSTELEDAAHIAMVNDYLDANEIEILKQLEKPND